MARIPCRVGRRSMVPVGPRDASGPPGGGHLPDHAPIRRIWRLEERPSCTDTGRQVIGRRARTRTLGLGRAGFGASMERTPPTPVHAAGPTGGPRWPRASARSRTHETARPTHLQDHIVDGRPIGRRVPRDAHRASASSAPPPPRSGARLGMRRSTFTSLVARPSTVAICAPAAVRDRRTRYAILTPARPRRR